MWWNQFLLFYMCHSMMMGLTRYKAAVFFTFYICCFSISIHIWDTTTSAFRKQTHALSLPCDSALAYQILCKLDDRRRSYDVILILQTAAMLKFYFRFRFWHFHCHRHVILHWPTKFYANWMIADGVTTSYWFHKMAAIASQICFGFLFGHVWHLRMSKAISIPNFDQISESAAEILLLSVSENKRPPY